LGTWIEGGFRPCQALQNFDSGGSSASVNQIVAPVPDPIRRKPSATFDLEDPVQFQEDFRASRVIDSTWPHEGNTVQVTVRGGQAHQPSSIDKNKTAQWRQERVLKTAGAQRRKPQGTKPIEEPRWELLKHWYSSSEVITKWNEQWVTNGGKGWTHISLIDYYMSMRTFQTCFHRCSTVSCCGSLLLRSHLVVRGNDN